MTLEALHNQPSSYVLCFISYSLLYVTCLEQIHRQSPYNSVFSSLYLYEGCSFCMVCSYFFTGPLFFIPMIYRLGPYQFLSGLLKLPPNVSYLPPELLPSSYQSQELSAFGKTGPYLRPLLTL